MFFRTWPVTYGSNTGYIKVAIRLNINRTISVIYNMVEWECEKKKCRTRYSSRDHLEPLPKV